MRKKTIAAIVLSVFAVITIVSCQKNDGSYSGKEITVISREEGSGTRGAFVELFGVEQNKVDRTTDTADITNSTEVMISSVEGNKFAIGYVSLGSLNSRVKALQIDGAEASVANIKNGTYKISRPFNIVTKNNVSETAQDFIDFILSESGQSFVEKTGYISVTPKGAYAAKNLNGKVTVAGSSSVTPVMEKLKEAYEVVNTNMKVEIQMSDSTTGVNSAVSGVADIGMASRDLKASEKDKGVSQITIASDGIAVIVNNNNPLSDVSKEFVRDVFVGDVTQW